MRVLAFAAVALLAAAEQPAGAASFLGLGGGSSGCTKGMLWPYVRNPGDCLTDAEIQAGMRGGYSGPTNTAPDIGAMAPAPQAAPQATPGIAPAYAAPPVAAQPSPVQTYAPPPGYVAAAPVPGVQAPAAMPQGMPMSDPNIRTVTSFSCNKSAMWPFVRKAGDCLTTEEKKRGQTGVYGGGSGLTVKQVYAQNGQPVAYQTAPVATVNNQGQVVYTTPAPPPAEAPACTKGPLWPFIKKAGDCQTSSEQKNKR